MLFPICHFSAPSQATSALWSVQHFSITHAASNTSNTASLSSVDTSRSVVFHGQSSAVGGNAEYTRSRLDIDSSTTVRSRRSDGTNASTVKGCVVEFASGIVNSVQNLAPQIASSGSQVDTTITSVNTSYAIALHCGSANNSTGLGSNVTAVFSGCTLTSSTNLRTIRGASPTHSQDNCVSVIEFNSVCIQSIQSFSITITAGTSGTATISSVTTANCLLVFNYMANTSGGTLQGQTRVTLTNGTTVTANSNASITTTVYGYVVEFKSQYVKSSQAVNTNFGASATTASITLGTSVTTSKSVLAFQGNSSGTSGNYATAYGSLALTGGTTVSLERGTSNNNSHTLYVQVFETN